MASIFEDKKTAQTQKTLSVKIPGDVADEIDKIKNRLSKVDPSKRFNTNAICVDALRKAIKQAHRELGGLHTENEVKHELDSAI